VLSTERRFASEGALAGGAPRLACPPLIQGKRIVYRRPSPRIECVFDLRVFGITGLADKCPTSKLDVEIRIVVALSCSLSLSFLTDFFSSMAPPLLSFTHLCLQLFCKLLCRGHGQRRALQLSPAAHHCEGPHRPDRSESNGPFLLHMIRRNKQPTHGRSGRTEKQTSRRCR